MPVIKLDKERDLRLDLNAMAKFEEITGKSLFKSDILKSMKATDLRALLWACLMHEDPQLTLEQVGAMVTSENMGEVTQELTALSGEGSHPL